MILEVKSKIQNPKSKIVVVGAGPAGASLAIRLAKEKFQVTLIERERFPRHKLCGEFISPECFRHFRELGVSNRMFTGGGERIAETIFYAPNGKSVGVPSDWFDKNEAGALSLSRAEMDLILLEQAVNLGVEVLEETSVAGLLLENGAVRGVKVKTKNGAAREIEADLTIDATGRAGVLGKLAGKIPDSKFQIPDSKFSAIQNPKSKIRNRLVGFKTHLKNVQLEKGRCEIYFFRGGYGGLSFVENNLANFCFLIEAEAVKKFNSDAGQIIENLVFQNRRAAETLDSSVPVRDWLAVSVNNFGLKDLNPAKNLFAVGDAGAFIDPFTGSGMLMALESAEILARIVGESSAVERIAEKYAAAHTDKFRKRLFVCSILRRAAFSPVFAALFINALNLGTLPRRVLAQATRPTFSG
ncbi:MAG: NAD(P)/FAD-dependent oxidoreductase [Acidobacteriota bacterium]|nr:NAD(P)/FAD-dependent oxidoreductase [Acidobacteriota bacterium]